ncbi:MAG: hypothetical protein IKF31_04245 [Clostridiales bacterium]|jgi:hypothetical protein|nr:hypothetical protein [Clostridiales bacterium]
MKMGFRKNLIALGLALSLVLAGTACSKKLSSDETGTSSSGAESVEDGPYSFSVLDKKINDYNLELNKFMKDHLGETTSKETEGATPGGVSAICKYTLTNDNKFEVLQMEKTLSNGMQVDEYFNMGDAVFIARTTIYNDGTFDPVDKYYIAEGTLYKVDSEAQTVTKIADLSDPAIEEAKASLDIYLTFDEIRALYA